ncbi:unnamed protein product [Gordionus sp. m RMFG-2023]
MFSKAYHLDAFRKLWPKYNPFKLTPNINPLTSFNPIFVDEWAACYYSKIWSMVLGADLHSYFLDSRGNLLPDNNLKNVGKRLLKEYLSVGSAIKQRQAIANFKGISISRDIINVEPFIKIEFSAPTQLDTV